MRKNKNTKSADDRAFSPKNRAADLLVVLLCLAGMALCLWLFRQDLYRTLSRLNVKPVGTVVLKHRVAQRRSERRLLWDYLQKTSPVYSGDFIRTGDRSEAALVLPGGVTDLAENTIIRIGTETKTGENRIELFGGALSFAAGPGGAVISSGKNTLALAAGGSVSAVSGDNGFAFRVDEGSAVLSAGGKAETFRAGEGSGPESAWPEKTAGTAPAGTTEPSAPRLIMPAEGAAYRNGGEIRFRWAADEDEGGLYTLEVADNPAMETAAVKMRVAGKRVVLSSLETGRWYWRVTPMYANKSAAAPPLSFTVWEGAMENAAAGANAAAGTAAAGTNAGTSTAGTGAAGTNAAGTSAGTAAAAGTSAAGTSAVAGTNAAAGAGADGTNAAAGTNAAGTNAAAGTSAAGAGAAGTNAAAAIPEPLPPPGRLRPENGYVLGPAQLRTSRSISFSWNPVPGAGAYAFSLYRETEGERRLVDSVELRNPSYTFTKLSLLERGVFVWTVKALRKESGVPEQGAAAESRFTVDIPVAERHELPESGNLYGD